MKKLLLKSSADDSAICLLASLTIEGFSGYGEGWFNQHEILDFSKNLGRLASDMTGTCELVGCQRASDGSTVQELLALRCYVLSKSKANGVLGMHVELANHPYTDCRQQEVLRVAGEIQARNGQVQRFSRDIYSFGTGSATESALIGDLSIFGDE